MTDTVAEFVTYVYHDIHAPGHVDRFVGLGVIYLATLAGFAALVFLIASALRWRARARLAEATVRDEAALVPGEAAVRGIVEHLPGAGGAVRLEIAQEGEEWRSSGSWVHAWTEKDRRMLVHPFLIRLPSGARVRVHPDQQVFLADALDGIIRLNSTARVRVAELTPGEAVVATGYLSPVSPGAGAYQESWILTPNGREPMILSTEPLGARYADRARVRGICASIAAVLLLVPQPFLIGFHLRSLVGHVDYGTIVGQSEDRTLKARFADGYELEREVARRVRMPGQVSALRVRGAPWADSFGREATVHWAPLAASVIAALFSLLLLFVLPTRWYEQRRLREGGTGRLDDELPTTIDRPADAPPVELPRPRLSPLLIGAVVATVLATTGILFYFLFVASPELESVRQTARTFVDRVRAGDLDEAYASAAPGFERNEPAWRAMIPHIQRSSGSSFNNLTIGSKRACAAGSLPPDEVLIVVLLHRSGDRWSVAAVANDEERVPGCENILSSF